MYWTKPDDMIFYTEELEVPHGDGFEVDMNGIDYQDYLADTASYIIVNGKLERVGADLPVSE